MLSDEEIDAVWPSPEGTNPIRVVASAIEAEVRKQMATEAVTPEQHAKAIEGAAMLFATINRQRIPKLSEFEALRSAIRAGVGAAPEGWQPIDTAPKDRQILAGRSGHPRVLSVQWHERNKHWATGPSPMDFFAGPTHWMPLPAPPKP